MARRHEINFANFICRFGDEKVMIDLAEQIVIPAFMDREIERKYKDTSYFFLQTKIIDFSEKKNMPVLGIVGRFIKNTLLEREQIYDDKNGLIKDKKAIQSSPSAVFVLILNNHKLIYLKETANAPSMAELHSTIDKFIRKKHEKFITDTYKRLKHHNKKASKYDVYREYPVPRIKIIPLSSEESLKEFVQRYQTLTTVETTLVQKNHEVDLNGFFSQLRETMDAVGAKRTALKHTNTKDGLSKEKVVEQLSVVAGQGNTEIKLNGKDAQGDTLNGDNHNFKIKVPIDEVKETVEESAFQMFDTFNKLIKNKTIKIAETEHSVNEKIKEIRDRL